MSHYKITAVLTPPILLLAGIVAAEPQPVDGGWRRSDDVILGGIGLRGKG